MSKTTNKYFPEVRERAVRLVLDNPGQRFGPMFASEIRRRSTERLRS